MSEHDPTIPTPGPLTADDEDRIIRPDDEGCPECGGFGRRGCGAVWHDSRPDTHCSPACQCRDEMQVITRRLRATVEQLQADSATLAKARELAAEAKADHAAWPFQTRPRLLSKTRALLDLLTEVDR